MNSGCSHPAEMAPPPMCSTAEYACSLSVNARRSLFIVCWGWMRICVCLYIWSSVCMFGRNCCADANSFANHQQQHGGAAQISNFILAARTQCHHRKTRHVPHSAHNAIFSAKSYSRTSNCGFAVWFLLKGQKALTGPGNCISLLGWTIIKVAKRWEQRKKLILFCL